MASASDNIDPSFAIFDIGEFNDVYQDLILDENWFLEDFDLEDVKEEAIVESTVTTAVPASRFADIAEAVIGTLIEQSRPKGTAKNTSWGVNILRQWLSIRGESPNFEMMEPPALNDLLRRFYAEVRNTAGEHYSKSSYVGLRAAIHRHLRNPPFERNINILNDKEFHSANNMFSSMLRNIKRMGLDKSSHYEPLTKADIALVRQNQSVDTPSMLQKKVWFDTTLGFGRRGCENQYALKKDVFAIESDETGLEYITISYFEATKNHRGDENHDMQGKPRIYATGTPLCPVLALKKYLSKLNPDSENFYQYPRKSPDVSNPVWYTKKHLGHNAISSMMKVISRESGLSKLYTNHCVRATTVTLLSHAGVEAREIMKLTGHKNQQSLMSYNRDSSATQKRQYSAILQGVENTERGVATHAQSQSSSVNMSENIGALLQGAFQISNSTVTINNLFHR